MDGLKTPWGRPDPENDTFSAKSQTPLFFSSPKANQKIGLPTLTIKKWKDGRDKLLVIKKMGSPLFQESNQGILLQLQDKFVAAATMYAATMSDGFISSFKMTSKKIGTLLEKKGTWQESTITKNTAEIEKLLNAMAEQFCKTLQEAGFENFVAIDSEPCCAKWSDELEFRRSIVSSVRQTFRDVLNGTADVTSESLGDFVSRVLFALPRQIASIGDSAEFRSMKDPSQ